MAAYFVLVPLVIYALLFAYESFMAFRRVGKPSGQGGQYLHATWEAVHTFLILGLTYFSWLYSSAVVSVGRAVFVPLLVFGAAFILRSILYIYLFYVKTSKNPNLLADQIFAWLHIVMMAALVFVVAKAVAVMRGGNYSPNSDLIPLLWPGLVIAVPLIAMPFYFLFKTKKR